MRHHGYLALFAVFASTMSALHWAALTFFWYWLYPWFDILMHGLGGLVVGVAVLWVLARLGKTPSRTHTLIIVVGAALIMGAAWEVFEWSIGVFVSEENILADTILDLIMDSLGGALASVFWKPKQPLAISD